MGEIRKAAAWKGRGLLLLTVQVEVGPLGREAAAPGSGDRFSLREEVMPQCGLGRPRLMSNAD